MSAIVGDVAMVICGATLLPTKLAGDCCSTTMSWFQVMFVRKEGRDDMTDGLLPRLDIEG